MKALKITYIVIVIFAFSISAVVNFEKIWSVKNILMTIIPFLYGVHLSYAYLFNTTMYARGISAETNEGQPIARTIVGVVGIIAICVGCYAFWHR